MIHVCSLARLYDTVEESLARNGFAPNRNPGRRDPLRRIA